MNNVIQATTIIRRFKSEYVLIPRIPLIPTHLSFQFKRVQYLVRFAMINKTQSQSLEVCGIYLELQYLPHKQLYMASSKVDKPLVLFVFSPDEKTKNIVHY